METVLRVVLSHRRRLTHWVIVSANAKVLKLVKIVLCAKLSKSSIPRQTYVKNLFNNIAIPKNSSNFQRVVFLVVQMTQKSIGIRWTTKVSVVRINLFLSAVLVSSYLHKNIMAVVQNGVVYILQKVNMIGSTLIAGI
jgi:hypothetical protein